MQGYHNLINSWLIRALGAFFILMRQSWWAPAWLPDEAIQQKEQARIGSLTFVLQLHPKPLRERRGAGNEVPSGWLQCEGASIKHEWYRVWKASRQENTSTPGGWHSPALQGQQSWDDTPGPPSWRLPLNSKIGTGSLHLAVRLYAVSYPLINWQARVRFLEFCELF